MNQPSRTLKTTMLLGLSVGLAFVIACSDGTSTSAPTGNGGATSTGGTAGNGGTAGASATATGGGSSSGGKSGTGGVHSSGGAAATGGANALGSGGTTGVSLPPACPTHSALSCPAIDSTKTFGSLSQADVSALCDCKIAAYGGFGTSQTCMCSDGSMAMSTNPTSKAACIASYKATSACTWVMRDYFKCMDLTQDTCNMMAVARSLGDPSCAAGMNNSACTTGQ